MLTVLLCPWKILLSKTPQLRFSVHLQCLPTICWFIFVSKLSQAKTALNHALRVLYEKFHFWFPTYCCNKNSLQYAHFSCHTANFELTVWEQKHRLPFWTLITMKIWIKINFFHLLAPFSGIICPLQESRHQLYFSLLCLFKKFLLPAL